LILVGLFIYTYLVNALLATPDVSSFYVLAAQFGSLSSPYNTIDIVLLAPVTKAAHLPPLATTTCKTVIAATSKLEKG